MKIHVKHYKYFIALFGAFFLFAGRPVEFGLEKSYFQGYSIEKPVIRVGIGVNLSRINIKSSSGMKIYRQDSSFTLLAQDVNEAQVKGYKEKLSEKFLIQAGQALKSEEAQGLAQQIRVKTGYSVTVIEDPEYLSSGRFQVRVGDFLTRGDALRSISQLNRLGYKDLWIIREEVTEKESHPLWILINDRLISLAENTSLFFIPLSSESYLSYEGISYRGVLVVRNSPGGVVLINILNLDAYLKGVVPSELSPYQFGELEALKAQAVAARTYALKNMGRYETLGFDLDDSQSSQVYKGLQAEHPLSSKAVAETRGLVARYQGQLINALYTSTCGGLTENVENVFGGSPSPYLRSVECTTELHPEWTLKTATVLRPVVWMGRDISREVALLASLKVIPSEVKDPAYFRTLVTAPEATEWLKRALALFGQDRDFTISQDKPLTASAFAGLAVEAFAWQDRVKNLLLRKEVDAALKAAPRLRGEERKDAAYLAIEDFVPASLDLADQSHILTKAELAVILARILTSEKPLLQTGTFSKLDKGRLEIIQNGIKKTWPLAPDPLLLRNLEGDLFFESELVLEGGEKVQFLEQDGAVRMLEAAAADPSPVLDKSSPYNRWQVRLSQADLERQVNLYYPLGHLVDVVPRKRGASPRVTELLVAGDEDQVAVNGLKVRWVLGLRDTWFSVDREYGPNGLISHFVFTGRGWGHGVGLCQVGAFRMAQLGGRFDMILKKYYRGITIDKIY